MAQQEQADAAVKAAAASLKVYKLNLDFCTVKSPIDGQVGRSNQPRGNLIMQDSTLHHRPVGRSHVRLFRHGYAQLPEISEARQGAEAKIAVSMALQGEEGYPARGRRFLQQPVNPATDTLLDAACFPTPEGVAGS
jgi:multidrug efflux system membrane fusion protein